MAIPAKYYSVRTLAEKWDVSRTHIYNMIEDGELIALRIGSAIRIKPEDVEAYEEGQRTCRAKEEMPQDIISSSGRASGTFAGRSRVVSLEAKQQARLMKPRLTNTSPTLPR
jgi:excisionase family DNA binding protein